MIPFPRIWIPLVTFTFSNWLQQAAAPYHGWPWGPGIRGSSSPALSPFPFPNHVFPWARANLANPTSLTPTLLCSEHLISMWGEGVFFHASNKQCSDTSWVFYNSTQFWHYLPWGGIWFHKLRTQSHKTPPATPTGDANCEPRLLPVLLTNWLQIGGSQDSLLRLQTPVASPGCYLYFWPTDCKSEVPTKLGFD